MNDDRSADPDPFGSVAAVIAEAIDRLAPADYGAMSQTERRILDAIRELVR